MTFLKDRPGCESSQLEVASVDMQGHLAYCKVSEKRQSLEQETGVTQHAPQGDSENESSLNFPLFRK